LPDGAFCWDVAAGERAHALQPSDLFINTTLSRMRPLAGG